MPPKRSLLKTPAFQALLVQAGAVLPCAALRERIAQLEESQRRLRESEERFRTLFDMTPLPLSVSDQEGRIIAANQALARTFGTPLHELIGKRSDEVTFWASPSSPARSASPIVRR